jgi:cytochrome c oxidase assembly factor CtaG
VADVSGHAWLVPLEGVTLLAFGLGLWLELVISPPLVPRSGYLRRAVLAAFSMWTFWILAYVLGLSNHAFYPNFAHVPGGLSAAADQQVASAVLWFVAAVSFVPVIFWNAMMWLRTDEDPDAELLALERAERRRGTPPLSGRQDGGSAGS